MKRIALSLVLLLFAGAFSVGQAHASTPYPITDEDRAFLASLKDALANHDKKWILDRVSLPIHARIHGHRQLIRTRAHLVAHFDEIFDDQVRAAVLAQTADNLRRGWQGAIIGRGEIWFETLLGTHGKGPPKTYIIAINN